MIYINAYFLLKHIFEVSTVYIHIYSLVQSNDVNTLVLTTFIFTLLQQLHILWFEKKKKGKQSVK